MPIISLSLEEKLLSRFDKKLSEKGHSGRSEAMRELIRDYISEQEWTEGAQESVAVINILYEKQQPRDNVSGIQHEHESIIQTSIHTHLGGDNCMEVLIAKGEGKEIKRLIEKITSVKGVKQVKYITTASDL
jgi:CopG family transcriptional regulator, nickel-responsive regulator